MADDLLEATEDTAEEKTEETPLGMYSPFPVSDQKEWTKEALDKVPGDLKLSENGRAMVEAACRRESLGRRIEVSGAWRLQLMDRGFHRLLPQRNGGWQIFGQNSNVGLYGAADSNMYHDVNIIGVHNDIIVNALARETPTTEFDAKNESDAAVTSAEQANKIERIIKQMCGYEKAIRKAGRTFCTDERAYFLMRPVADAQTFGFQEDTPDVVPETEESIPAGNPSQKPRIQPVLTVYGKLEHKTEIGIDEDEQSPYQIIATEQDTASQRAKYPWIASEITGGSAGIAEIELDRVARASIKLAIQGGMVTGQGNVNDTTELMCWLSPKFYWDDSCSEQAREWFLENFPKGSLWVYSGVEQAFARNEAWQETGTVVHARTGKGQNRRALTEAYAGPNMVLDNLFDLIVKFFTSTVPRVFYDAKVFNVPQLRSSGNTVGRKEPFNSALVTPNVLPVMTDPMPTHQPALPDFIHWLAEDLAQLLTGAQLTLQGAQNADGEQGTLGEAKMDNMSAMMRLSEPWGALCGGLSSATMQAIQWMSRVCPEQVFDQNVKDLGRIRVEMENLNADLLVVADTNSNFPESWSEREERVWQLVAMMPTNPYITSIVMQPANAKILKNAARMGITIPGASSWEKQEGEFTVLLTDQPQPNPQVAQIQAQISQLKPHMEQGAQDVQMRQQAGQPVDPKEVEMLQQGLQTIQQLMQQAQQLPPLISTVAVRADGSEEDAIEEACCLAKMISPEGRRLYSSKNMKEKAAFANLHLHWFEHKTAKEKLAGENQQPVEPKASMTVAVDKLPGSVQSQLFSKMGIAAKPEDFNQMGPHLVTHEVEGVNAQGATEKIKTELAGKQLD